MTIEERIQRRRHCEICDHNATADDDEDGISLYSSSAGDVWACDERGNCNTRYARAQRVRLGVTIKGVE